MTDLSSFAAMAKANLESLDSAERELVYLRTLKLIADERERILKTRNDGGENSVTILVLDAVAKLIVEKHGELVAPST